MNAITQFGSAGFTLALLLILILSGQDLWNSAGIRMACVLACGQSVVVLVKRAVHRPRPFKSLIGVINHKPTICPYSLPSGHTNAAFVQALVLADTVPELSAMFLILATLVGLSRVYLGVHYPTDVAAGGLIGYTAFCAVSHWIF
ncbi:MAG: phosphatase PAP2 family protein [Syntrophomonadaceae bacterium]|nr:phosphatase PAP2 family protein [Syntrophomonadaceae bacterium]